MRLFVSVDLPERLADSVADLQGALAEASGLDFVDPEQAHVTLKFLGEVDEGRERELAGALERAVDESGVEAFDAELAGLGVFPSLDYISVVWLGVDAGSAELARLHEGIETEFVDEHGFEAEDHEFTPHVTLARMNHAGGKELVQRLVEERHPEVGTVRVDEVRLTESTLTPAGPEYETVHAVDL
ncbi:MULTISPECIES: RNA 2',3'-cyclic phosphodiesterase [Halobacterium]|uniref:RNA 2',3'-cyclic phosphodiesterase n=1 Tax=Halobacterium TaxID=2239 RepID=UPI00073F06BD|nr:MULTISPECIES: RNA 2',3'-cyclic phosphodiesterase [Halobacterium]MCG1004434.1 RNA 2',3'-cyclic phosphodiesterase [Halobacterium noricense]